MARIRTVKPEMFVDDVLCALPAVIRWIFVGLFCQADKAGRLEDRPERIRATVAPYDKRVDVDAALSVLHAHKFIVRYEMDGHRYIQIRTWDKHQRPHHTEPESIIPACAPSDNGANTVAQPLSDGEKTLGKEGKGKEIGMEGKGEARPRAVLSAPASFAEFVWQCWRATSETHGQREPLTLASESYRRIKALEGQFSTGEVEAAIGAFWRSPSFAGKRHLHMCLANVPQLVAHVASGSARPFGERAATSATADDEGAARLAAWAAQGAAS